MEQKLLNLFLFAIFINIISVLCENTDCKNFISFALNNHVDNIEIDDCCLTYGVNCENDKIVEIVLDFSEKTVDLSDISLLQNLEKLSLANFNSINKVLPESIFDMPNLKYLEIFSSSINAFPENINSSSPLEEIILPYNMLNSFPYQLKNLKNLKELNLIGNEISDSLTNEIKEFPVLKYLNVAENNMFGEIIIPDTLISLEGQNNSFDSIQETNINNKIEEIILYDNNLKDDSFKSIVKMLNLKSLDISNNYNIKQIPSEIQNLVHLEKIGINHIKNIIIPDEFFNLFNLTDFTAYDSNIDDNILEKITEFEFLSYLSIGKNEKITKIPESIENLKYLKVLTISELNIETLPNSIFNLNLESLDISYNPQLKTKIKNFANIVEECYFDKTDILCYQEDTCENYTTDPDDSELTYCTDSDLE